MVIIINSWKPDTCSCTLHYFVDDAQPQQDPTFFAIEDACEFHQPLEGLQNGEPDWLGPDHNVDTENAIRFAIIDDALERNQTNNLSKIQRQEDRDKIVPALQEHNQKVVERYSKIFDPSNAKAISKGIWNSAKEENDRKNVALETVLLNGPNSLYNIVDGVSRTVKEGIGFGWSWSGIAPNRSLTMRFNRVTLTNAQKNTIRNALNTRFGQGRVNLV